MPDISPTSQPGFFRVYLDHVEENDPLEAFSNQAPVFDDFLSAITEEKSMYAYAIGKWTLKEMLQHIMDAERIFAYRALCFARKETAVLPSFEENDYAAASQANNRTWVSLVKEFTVLRQSSRLLFESFNGEMLATTGKAGNNILSVRDLGLLMVGHFKHHKKIMEERYLVTG